MVYEGEQLDEDQMINKRGFFLYNRESVLL